jgi:3-oxoacyl-[acyl-carrier protein] reductase
MVAGASRGLGYAVARALAAEGAHVSLMSRSVSAIREAASRIEQETSADALALQGDVCSTESIERWHAATLERFGGVDLVFTNSGGPPPGSALGFDDESWQHTFELLVLSVVRLVRTTVPSMARRGKGSVVIATSSSVKEPIPNLALSTVLRASVSALAKTLALELAAQNIRVNQLVPGRIDTDRVRELDEANGRRLGISAAEQRSRSAAAIPLGRYGVPEEFGRAAAFLLSDAASYVTGATLQVDGGLIRSIL